MDNNYLYYIKLKHSCLIKFIIFYKFVNKSIINPEPIPKI